MKKFVVTSILMLSQSPLLAHSVEASADQSIVGKVSAVSSLTIGNQMVIKKPYLHLSHGRMAYVSGGSGLCRFLGYSSGETKETRFLRLLDGTSHATAYMMKTGFDVVYFNEDGSLKEIKNIPLGSVDNIVVCNK